MATVSHELRTPLTSIRAYAETLARGLGSAPRETEIEFLKIIEQEANRLTTIVENMLELSHLESGKIKVNKANVNLRQVVKDTCQILAPSAEKKLIQIEAETQAKPLTAYADDTMIKQMLLNLVGNAVKFTPEGGKVRVRLEEKESTVEIVVEDTGIGIPEDEIDRIFDGFYQVDSSATRKYGGVGLGLAIVKNIVEWHDGKVWVESKVGKGTKFIVSLPKRKAVAARRMDIISEGMELQNDRAVPELIVDMIAEVMGAKNASLMLVNEETEELYIGAAMGLDEYLMRSARVRVGEGISGWVAKTGKPLLIRDIEKDRHFGRRNRPNYETKSLISVPLKRGGKVIGVLNVTNKISLTPFTEDETEVMEMLAERVSLILEKMRRYQSVKGEFQAIVNSLQCLIESRRFALTKRGERATRLVVELGRAMGLGEEDVRLLQYVSRIYDVGMVRVGEGILRKRGGLGAGEYECIKRHPVEGVDIVGPIEFLEQVKEIILHHHERYDGKGYPSGLSGEEIPIGARILAVVDAYESMVSERPYRRALSSEEAIEELRRCSGKQFDPVAVEKFIQILNRLEGEKERVKDES